MENAFAEWAVVKGETRREGLRGLKLPFSQVKVEKKDNTF